MLPWLHQVQKSMQSANLLNMYMKVVSGLASGGADSDADGEADGVEPLPRRHKSGVAGGSHAGQRGLAAGAASAPHPESKRTMRRQVAGT